MLFQDGMHFKRREITIILERAEKERERERERENQQQQYDTYAMEFSFYVIR
jgi:hypothetical protein